MGCLEGGKHVPRCLAQIVLGLDQPGPEGEVRISYKICLSSWKNHVEEELRVCLLRPSSPLGLRSAQPPAARLSFAKLFSKDWMP